MPKWTDEQNKAIHTRGSNLLVSAAAGSGKTAVLSARVGDFVAGGKSLDRLLVVTFTKMAAAEMRTRIAKELNTLARNDPSNAHLRRQSLTLYKAKISTIDSFGIDLLRRNFQHAGLSPDFTVLDPTELTVLNASVFQEMTEECFRSYPEGFYEFLTLSESKNVAQAEQTVFALLGYLDSIPFPDRWLDEQIRALDEPGNITDRVCELLLPCAEEYLSLARAACDEGAFTAKSADKVAEERDTLSRLCEHLRAKDWEKVCRTVCAADPGRAPSAPKQPHVAAMTYAEYRKSTPVQAKNASLPSFFSRQIFRLDADTVKKDAEALRPALLFLLRFAGQLRTRLREQMDRRAAYSFSVISEIALELVVTDYSHATGAFTPSPIALAERALYDEVLIDEYQDVNDRQDLFFRAITDDNCFAVGDVKQSIYGFRGANPKNFLRKQDEKPEPIYLNKNFRSRAGILDCVNFLFRGLFSKSVGGIEYGEKERLNVGREKDDANPYPPDYSATLPPAGEEFPEPDTFDREPDTEFLLLPTKSGETSPNAVAKLCATLVRDAVEGGATVYDKDEKAARPMRYSDVAILLRASKSSPIYEEVFREAGIPLLCADGETFLETPEVGGVIAFLKAVNDPWDDLALFVTLTGKIFSFTPEKVSYLTDPNGRRPLWEGLVRRAQQDADCANVIEVLQRYRILAENLPVPKLIWEIYTQTDYLALEACEGRGVRSNLMKFYSFSCTYPRTDGLFGFLEYTERARDSGKVNLSSSAPEGDFVRLMTIHKSKGLEFPWCLIPEMESPFPADRDKLKIDGEVGVAAKVRDEKTLSEYTTLPLELIRLKESVSETAERLRVLYVALTRARDRMTVISEISADTNRLAAYALHSENGAVRLTTLLNTGSFRGYLLDRLSLHPQAKGLHSNVKPPSDETTEPLRVSFVGEPQTVTPVRTERESLCCGLSPEELKRRFSFRYPTTLSTVPAKVSVTEIAKQTPEPETALLIDRPSLLRPHFLSEDGMSGAETGTALHKYCQHADLRASVADEKERLVREGLLCARAAEEIDEELLNAFLQSPLAERIRTAKSERREVRFVCRIPVSYYTDNPGQEGEMLMQGAIDLLYETEQGYHIVDFKSDRLGEKELLAQYSKQLNLYAAAVRRLYDKPVLGCSVWSFRLKKEIPVPEEAL